jgi:hypothetical protein
MKKHVRKWMVAGLVALMAAPALAGCVVRPGYGYYGYHDRGWHDRGWHDHGYYHDGWRH